MHDGEKREFKGLLDAMAAYYDRRLQPATIAIYWQGLADLPIEAVRAALNAHVQDPAAGQFMPKIADIRRQIEAHRDDGHPGAEEAWSIALGARDEGASVVWTEQISAAFFAAAMPLLDEGDKIAARKAFIERYELELTSARRAGIAARWAASLGSDAHQRERAIEAAVRAGRLDAGHAQRLLPHSDHVASAAMVRLENGVASTGGASQVDALRKLLRAK